MNEDVVLTRPVAIRGWRVVGLVAKAGKRRELEPILRRADEAGETHAEDVAEHLLPAHSRKSVAARLLYIATKVRLLEKRQDRRFVLSEDGRRALESGQILLPEQGAWTVWASSDPLLLVHVLRIESWDEPNSAVSESRRDREEERPFVPLPDWFDDVQGMEFTPPASEDGVAVRIDALEEKVERVEPVASLRLVWNVARSRLRLRGEWEGEKVDAELEAPQVPSPEIWDALLDGEGLMEHWDDERRALTVPFEDTTESERESMSRELGFRKPCVPDYGEFDPLALSGTTITARSRGDARKWSGWRLNARVRDFATAKRYAAWWKEAVEPFAGYGLELPGRAELAESEWKSVVGRPSPRAWHLVAAEEGEL